MGKSASPVPSKALSDIIVKGIEDKKGLGILVLDLRDVESAICDYFIISHGNTDKQVDAIANSVVDHVRDACGEKPWHEEGRQNNEWVLIDYSNVVVHIFQKDVRDFYKLEELWADAHITPVEVSY
ncbi:ribosome silencing factor [bacterium SCSIO 12741]|nr:ribosome silencing factor [bacterium SCSIO 12741]